MPEAKERGGPSYARFTLGRLRVDRAYPSHLCHPERTTQVVADFFKELNQRLTIYLAKNKVVFAWFPQEIRGISPRVMEHKINVFLEARPIRQKKQHFIPENDKIINDKVTKLLEGGHIWEV